MATTTVLLREDLDTVGGRGEVVKVKAGFARNYLLPKGLATLATKGNIKQIEQERSALLKKSAIEKATAGYKEINLRALKLLNPGGILVTCSCSYHVNEAAFAEIVYEAAVDAQAHVTVVEKRMQGCDHPVLLGVPETYYLKCFILRKLA